MTQPPAALADAIMALINSKAQSPTREELLELIVKTTQPARADPTTDAEWQAFSERANAALKVAMAYGEERRAADILNAAFLTEASPISQQAYDFLKRPMSDEQVAVLLTSRNDGLSWVEAGLCCGDLEACQRSCYHRDVVQGREKTNG